MDRYTLSKDVRDFVMEKGSGSFQASPDKDLDVARTILSTSHKMHRAGVDNYVERKKESQKNDELIIPDMFGDGDLIIPYEITKYNKNATRAFDMEMVDSIYLRYDDAFVKKYIQYYIIYCY